MDSAEKRLASTPGLAPGVVLQPKLGVYLVVASLAIIAVLLALSAL